MLKLNEKEKSTVFYNLNVYYLRILKYFKINLSTSFLLIFHSTTSIVRYNPK